MFIIISKSSNTMQPNMVHIQEEQGQEQEEGEEQDHEEEEIDERQS